MPRSARIWKGIRNYVRGGAEIGGKERLFPYVPFVSLAIERQEFLDLFSAS